MSRDCRLLLRSSLSPRWLLVAATSAALFVVALASCSKFAGKRDSSFVDRVDAVNTEAQNAPPASFMPSKTENNAGVMASAVADEAIAPPASPARPGTRQLIRTASLGLAVTNVDSVVRRASAIAISHGGFISGLSSSRREELPVCELTLRVPEAQLDRALEELRSLAVRVQFERIETQDVTDQVVDLGARLKTLRATEAELLVLLHESRARAHKVAEVMAIYRELTGIRTQIEQIDAQRESLVKLAALSTISLHVEADVAVRPVAASGWRPGATARACFTVLVTALRGLGDALIGFTIVVLPLGGLLALSGLVVARMVRRLARANAAS